MISCLPGGKPEAHVKRLSRLARAGGSDGRKRPGRAPTRGTYGRE